MTDGVSEARSELAAIAASLHAHLEMEARLKGPGLPRVQVPQPEIPAVSPPPADPPGRSDPPPESSGALTHIGASMDFEEKQRRLAVLADEAAACTRCVLHEGRTHSAFARGSPQADLVFVGEGPGFEEDRQGLPFVGKAGKLLDRMVAAMGYGRDEVYICNVVKCRPPENRTPKPDEAAACERFLVGQLELVSPRVIVALGRCAAENLGCVPGKGRWRGAWRQWRGVPVMPTYHPAFLLRSPEFKRPVWEDLQHVMRRLGKEPPARKR